MSKFVLRAFREMGISDRMPGFSRCAYLRMGQGLFHGGEAKVALSVVKDV